MVDVWRSRNHRLVALLFVLLIGLSGCDAGPPPVEFSVRSTVNDSPVADAQLIFRKATNRKKSITAYSDATGAVSVALGGGAYEVEIYAPGYWTTGDLVGPVLTVDAAEEFPATVRLAPTAGAGGMGWIDATVSDTADRTMADVVVVAVGEDVFGQGIRTVYGRSDGAGVSRIPNLTAGSYTLEAYGIGVGTRVIPSVNVVSGQGVSATIRVGSNQLGSIHGTTGTGPATAVSRTFTLREPRTGATVKRMELSPNDAEFLFQDVAIGSYHLHVESSDGAFVASAHEQAMYGGLNIQVNVGDSPLFEVPLPPAVSLTEPVNGVLTNLQPELIWSTVSEADFYVVEVTSAANEVVYGGFADDGTARLEIPQGVTSIAYGDLSHAAVATEYIPAKYLAEGQRYGWRVYACVYDTAESRGYRAVAVSPFLAGSFQAGGLP